MGLPVRPVTIRSSLDLQWLKRSPAVVVGVLQRHRARVAPIVLLCNPHPRWPVSYPRSFPGVLQVGEGAVLSIPVYGIPRFSSPVQSAAIRGAVSLAWTG